MSASKENRSNFIVKARLSHSQGSLCILRPKQCHAFKTFNPKSNQQAKRNRFPIFTAALRQPRETLSSYRTFLLSTSCHRYRSCQLAKRTDPILSSQLDSVTAKGVYACSDQSNIMHSRRSIQSPISKRRETNFQSSLLRSDSQGKHCHHTGHFGNEVDSIHFHHLLFGVAISAFHILIALLRRGLPNKSNFFLWAHGVASGLTRRPRHLSGRLTRHILIKTLQKMHPQQPAFRIFLVLIV